MLAPLFRCTSSAPSPMPVPSLQRSWPLYGTRLVLLPRVSLSYSWTWYLSSPAACLHQDHTPRTTSIRRPAPSLHPVGRNFLVRVACALLCCHASVHPCRSRCDPPNLRSHNAAQNMHLLQHKSISIWTTNGCAHDRRSRTDTRDWCFPGLRGGGWTGWGPALSPYMSCTAGSSSARIRWSPTILCLSLQNSTCSSFQEISTRFQNNISAFNFIVTTALICLSKALITTIL